MGPEIFWENMGARETLDTGKDGKPVLGDRKNRNTMRRWSKEGCTFYENKEGTSFQNQKRKQKFARGGGGWGKRARGKESIPQEDDPSFRLFSCLKRGTRKIGFLAGKAKPGLVR